MKSLKITSKSKENVTLEGKVMLSWDQFNKYFEISKEDNLQAVVKAPYEDRVQKFMDELELHIKEFVKLKVAVKVAEEKGRVPSQEKAQGLAEKYKVLESFGLEPDRLDRMTAKRIEKRVQERLAENKQFKPATSRLGDNPAFAKLLEAQD